MTAAPRGPMSARLLRALAGRPGPVPALVPSPGTDPCADEDLQLCLHLAYELHYRGLPGVDEDWEWHPELLAAIRPLERAFERWLRERCPSPPVHPDDVVARLHSLLDVDGGPSLSAYVAEHGDAEQLREFLVHRSIYQLKEADPHAWGFPRLSGRAKAAFVEIQADEYGGGVPGRAHAELFAATLRSAGLDDAYGAHLEAVPATTLATGNLISLLGIHRRLRGALVGHLAAFEMTSVGPMGRYASALRRLGLGGEEFYDVHVLADAHHEVVAATGLVGGLVEAEPELAADVLFGAQAVQLVERRFAEHLLDSWAAGRSSLRAQVTSMVPCMP